MLKTVVKSIYGNDLFGTLSLLGKKKIVEVAVPRISSKKVKEKPAFFETIKIQPTYAVSFYRSTNPKKREKKIPVYNKHNGQVSNKAATKIRNAINWMLLFSQTKFVYSKAEKKTFSFKLNFITLTLPSEQKQSDDYVKKEILVPFIEWMTKTKGAFMWLWKAEAQNNGNIHFHITSHQFIHWRSVRAKWNTLCAKHGYCKVFQDGSNDKGDSATQIKAAKNPETVGAYLAKYISKNDRTKNKAKKPKGLPIYLSQLKSETATNYCYSSYSVLKRPIEGRLWACSNNIASINCFVSQFKNSGLEIDTMREEIISITENTKEDRYYNCFFYENICTGNVPELLKKTVDKLRPKNKQQTSFEVETLLA